MGDWIEVIPLKGLWVYFLLLVEKITRGLT